MTFIDLLYIKKAKYICKKKSCRELSAELCSSPCFAEPVAHDGDHTGPDGGLQQAVQHPQAAVQVHVVNVEPFSQSAEHKLLQHEEQRHTCVNVWGAANV